MKSIQKTKKLWMIGAIVGILFVSSFSTIINNSMLPVSKALAAFEVEDNQIRFNQSEIDMHRSDNNNRKN
jgi:hypothetical protein